MVKAVNVRVNLTKAELECLHDFMLNYSSDFSDSILGVFKKLKLVLYKLDMDMPVAGYEVSGTKRVSKYSTEGMGFSSGEAATPKDMGISNEDFMANIMAAAKAKGIDMESNQGNSNEPQ